jgi:hypothetical protein
MAAPALAINVKTPPTLPGAFHVIWFLLDAYAAMVAWACSDHGPRSPVGETHRIQT